MRRLALLVLVLPLAAACGGGRDKAAPPTSTAQPSDPGQAAVVALFAAAQKDDRKALWNLLSKPSRKRLGGYDTFRREGALVMERALAPFGSKPPTPFISQGISEHFGVVAIRKGAKALALALRNEGGVTKIETPGPLVFRILSPAPDGKSRVSQIAVEVDSRGIVDDAVLWLDGNLVRPNLAPKRGKATVYASLARPLPGGPHVAVVFAEEGNDAGAEAWAFRASNGATTR
jgi:hypothetical protein